VVLSNAQSNRAFCRKEFFTPGRNRFVFKSHCLEIPCGGIWAKMINFQVCILI
jgi:hypothetical protein